MTPNRSVLITGASSGIGFAAARLFARRGWHVIACTRTGTGHPEHPGIRGMRMDVDVPQSVDACFRTLRDDDTVPDVLVNNAGWGLCLPFEAMDEAEIAAMFQTNVFGTMRVTRAWLSALGPDRAGTVITVGSLAGEVGLAYHSAYCATKHAVEGWSESLRHEVGHTGIAVKIVEPLGRTATGFFRKAAVRERGREGTSRDAKRHRLYAARQEYLPASLTAEDVAETIARAATDGTSRSRYIVWRKPSERIFLLLHRLAPSLADRVRALRAARRLR